MSTNPTGLAADRPRRTQQERRDGTRHALLEATVSALVELGYSDATTLEVERRAGVSRGARIHHFPTKAALLSGAVDHLYNQLSDHYERAFGRAGAALSDEERFRSGLRLLWSIYKQRAYIAALELNMAARTDAELRASLRSVAERHRNLAVAAAAEHFPVIDRDLARALIEAIHVSLTGLLLQRNVNEGRERAHVEDMVLGLLDRLVAVHLSPVQNEAERNHAADRKQE
jgi:AcrR family transcriptional regulator